MKAVVHRVYRSAEVLHVTEVQTPKIGEDEVLVRVMTASVHAADAVLVQGIPYVMLLAFGLSRPHTPTPHPDPGGGT
jgi:NADPH:quinone reductase-like Zn-dependent oxidoreductase